jgi:Ca-activated chloride channel homolog
MMKKNRLKFYGRVGLFLGIVYFVVACAAPSAIGDLDSAYQYLQGKILPNIKIDLALVSDTSAQSRVIPPLADPVPDVSTFPLYGAQPSSDSGKLYVEIFTSVDKGNGDRPDERWLVDVAEAFNQQQNRVDGQVIQIGIRGIASGIAAEILAAKKAQPAGYSPTSALWLEKLKQQGIAAKMIEPKLMSDCGGLAIEGKAYQQLASKGEVTFARLLDQILAGQFKLGYANPYISTASINLLYQILWQAAGHDKDGKPLMVSEINSPQMISVFDTFQKQVTVMGLTAIDLKDIFLRDSSQLQVFASGCIDYAQIKNTPGHEQLGFVPFGTSHNNPLVGFEWNTNAEREALRQFAKFAVSPSMQQRLPNQGDISQSLKQYKFISPPSGAVIEAAQALWKRRKDGGKTVYLEMVIDTSGSMAENERLKAVQAALKAASQQINSGNQVGLITFSDRPVRRIKFAPFNELEKKRLLTAIDELQPDGATALYDALAVGIGDLMDQQKRDPDGLFSILLLTDGERTEGIELAAIRDVIKQSGIRIYPIAYGEVNQAELTEIAAIREGSVYKGDPESVQTLLYDLFQTKL